MKEIFRQLAVAILGLVLFCGPSRLHPLSVFSATLAEAAAGQQPHGVVPVDSRPVKLTPHLVVLSKTKRFNLNLPPGFEITVAAQGLKRPRFMSKGPDGRIFLTDMFNRTDNQKGAVYVLDGFDASTGKFNKLMP